MDKQPEIKPSVIRAEIGDPLENLEASDIEVLTPTLKEIRDILAVGEQITLEDMLKLVRIISIAKDQIKKIDPSYTLKQLLSSLKEYEDF